MNEAEFNNALHESFHNMYLNQSIKNEEVTKDENL